MPALHIHAEQNKGGVMSHLCTLPDSTPASQRSEARHVFQPCFMSRPVSSTLNTGIDKAYYIFCQVKYGNNVLPSLLCTFHTDQHNIKKKVQQDTSAVVSSVSEYQCIWIK